jgi:hypothetical protein
MPTVCAIQQLGERGVERLRVIDEDFLRPLRLDLFHEGLGGRFAGKGLLQLGCPVSRMRTI